MPGRKQQAQVADVKNTDAKGDGVTDDTAAVQAALDADAGSQAVPGDGTPDAADDTSGTPNDDQGNSGTEGASPAGPAQPGDGTPLEADQAGPVTPPVTGGTPAAAPLAPPAPKVTPRTPAPAATEPNAAPRQPDGGHVGYTDHAGNKLKHDELFTDPGPQFTFMIAAKRILQTFHFPGQHRDSTRTSAQLVYNAGVRVPRHAAHALIQAVKADIEGGKSATEGGSQDS